jgi:hypothetical protein
MYTCYIFLNSLHLVSHQLFCIQWKKQPSIQSLYEGVMTISRMENKSNLIAITRVLAYNWFKTARLLRTDDSMVIYTLFSRNLGHI